MCSLAFRRSLVRELARLASALAIVDVPAWPSFSPSIHSHPHSQLSVHLQESSHSTYSHSSPLPTYLYISTFVKQSQLFSMQFYFVALALAAVGATAQVNSPAEPVCKERTNTKVICTDWKCSLLPPSLLLAVLAAHQRLPTRWSLALLAPSLRVLVIVDAWISFNHQSTD